jgi:2-methylcitrate dehydratase PrpD
MDKFIDRLCEAVFETDGGDSDSRALIGRGIADTVAVAAAGFSETVTRSAIEAYGGTAARAWSGAFCESREAAVMMNAIAAHALDFDDVYLETLTHPNAVIVPAVLQLGTSHDPEQIIGAAAAGLIAARAIGGRLGQTHYLHGWHGTGTVGVFAAAASAGRLASLGTQQMKWAFGLAAAMSGGLQKNFSTMAKPCQAGFAAAAGLRAVRLASANITASENIFETNGYFDVYGDGRSALTEDLFALRPDRISVKLYPCCYAASRLIGIALDAYRDLGPIFADPAISMNLVVPHGSIDVLRYDDPTDGLQAKFSATYTVSAALLDGMVNMPHFGDAALHRQDIRECMTRLTISEDRAQPSGGELETGVVRLRVFNHGDLIGSYSRHAIPGSPADAANIDQIKLKAAGCYSVFEGAFGHTLPILDEICTMAHVAPWVGDRRQFRSAG